MEVTKEALQYLKARIANKKEEIEQVKNDFGFEIKELDLNCFNAEAKITALSYKKAGSILIEKMCFIYQERQPTNFCTIKDDLEEIYKEEITLVYEELKKRIIAKYQKKIEGRIEQLNRELDYLKQYKNVVEAKCKQGTKQYGYWTVLEDMRGKKSHQKVLCRCKCGMTNKVTVFALKEGKSKSCGCLRIEQQRKNAITVSFEGGQVSLLDIAKNTGIPYSTIYTNYRNGKDLEAVVKKHGKAEDKNERNIKSIKVPRR